MDKDYEKPSDRFDEKVWITLEIIRATRPYVSKSDRQICDFMQKMIEEVWMKSPTAKAERAEKENVKEFNAMLKAEILAERDNL